MQNKKWYVVCKYAEGRTYGIVALTEDYCKGWNDCYDAIMKKLEGLK